ncbi:MAG TPA: glucose 1-dehydrogenase [Tepidisphaeraceae bacterium]|jgi:NAD(P)-dependent dehydrogenase (short-subunit alcohol dehydrogenase family)
MIHPARNFTDLTDRVAVVIGGTSGLGQTIALGMAEAGAHVIPTGRRVERIEETSAKIKAMGRRSLVHAADVANRQSIDQFRDAVIREFGTVDILVNSAGITLKKPTTEITEEEWNSVIDTNLTGMLRTCQSFHEILKASGRGRVINVASLASFVAFHQVTAYGVSKAGVLALTRSLGIEWARDNICVNAVAPGIFQTDLNSAFLNGTERGRELLTRTPMRRFGKGEELIGAAVFLASDAVQFITGQIIPVDGGFLASGVNS